MNVILFRFCASIAGFHQHWFLKFTAETTYNYFLGLFIYNFSHLFF